MPKLVSRTKWPPGGFVVLHPEAGMKKPFSGSFIAAVDFELQFRRKNTVLAQRLGLPPNRGSCEDWVDEYNARRCLSAGFPHFVMDSAKAQAEKKTLHQRLGGAVVGVLSKTRAAISAYSAMFGSVGPVAKEKATTRAGVCVTCPNNNTQGGLAAFFTESAASEIMGVLGVLKDLDLHVPQAANLGVCSACSCPLKAKVFAPIQVVVDRMPADVWGKLPANCWLRTESGRHA